MKRPIKKSANSSASFGASMKKKPGIPILYTNINPFPSVPPFCLPFSPPPGKYKLT